MGPIVTDGGSESISTNCCPARAILLFRCPSRGENHSALDLVNRPCLELFLTFRKTESSSW